MRPSIPKNKIKYVAFVRQKSTRQTRNDKRYKADANFYHYYIVNFKTKHARLDDSFSR